MISPSRAVLRWVTTALVLLALPAPALAATHPYNTGCRRLESGDLTGAETAFKAALKLNARDTDALNNLAVVYIRQDRPTNAESLLKKALGINSRYAGADANLGASELIREDFKASVLDSEKATKAPRSAEGDKVRAAAYHNLGVVYLDTGKPKEAWEAFSSSLAVMRDDETLLGAGVAACATGDFESGTATLKEVCDKLEPGPAREEAEGMLAAGYCDLAWSRLEEGDKPGAAAAFTQASDLLPKTEGALGSYVLAAEDGDYSRAIAGLEDLAKTSPDPEVRQAASVNAARTASLQDQATAPLKWSALAAAAVALVAHAVLLIKVLRSGTTNNAAKTGRIVAGVLVGPLALLALVGQVIQTDRSIVVVATACVIEAAVLAFMWSMKRVAYAW